VIDKWFRVYPYHCCDDVPLGNNCSWWFFFHNLFFYNGGVIAQFFMSPFSDFSPKKKRLMQNIKPNLKTWKQCCFFFQIYNVINRSGKNPNSKCETNGDNWMFCPLKHLPIGRLWQHPLSKKIKINCLNLVFSFQKKHIFIKLVISCPKKIIAWKLLNTNGGNS
jgi:hypothetical protein